jgi:hypothetical protein
MIRRLAPFAVIALYVTSAAATLWLKNLNGEALTSEPWIVVGVAPYAAVGALIMRRRHHNPMGWIFSAIGLLWATGALAEEYALRGFVLEPGSLPSPVWAAWHGEWYWLAFWGLVLVFMPLLFPTGKIPSRRWRPVLWMAVATVGGFSALAALESELQLAQSRVTAVNPFGIPGLHDVESGLLGGVLALLMLVSVCSAVASLVVRFRHSTGTERLQLKWFTYASVLFVAGFISMALVDVLAGARSTVADVLVVALVPMPALGAGIAILKYRLYDIDRIINKTLVYGAVTALLAVGYFAGIVAAQAIVPVAGDSPVVVAATTLAMVALFRPLRNRIQDFVDRRFYRRRYDAARTIESFGSRLRQETDLDSLSSELLMLVSNTMQPAHASLWLRPEGPRE